MGITRNERVVLLALNAFIFGHLLGRPELDWVGVIAVILTFISAILTLLGLVAGGDK